VRRFFTENFGWKLLSLASATVLWFWLIAESELATSVSVPVQFENLPGDLELSSEVVERLFLKVRGPVSRLNLEQLSRATVLLDLSNVNSDGEFTYNLDENTVRLPSGLKLTRVVPSQVRVLFEKRATRDVPVEVRFAGPPPDGYRVANVWISPQRVRITGAESHVSRTNNALTDPIDLQSTVGDKDFRTSVYLEDTHVRLESTASVLVRVRLEKIAPRKN
jgi:YbbR domain-containing protein